MLKFLAVDDEPYALEDLEETLRMAVQECELTGFSEPGRVLEYAGKFPLDVAFLDIELGSVNGLVLAKQLKELQPGIHIIFVTSHDQYAVGAFKLHASGYLMKPVAAEDIKRELTFLYGEEPVNRRVRVQTFGGFEIYVDGKVLQFRRSKAKELLAYLVDKRGASISNGDACAALWEDAVNTMSQKSYYRTIVSDLSATLKQAGAQEILLKGYNRLAIVPELLDCDSYRFLDGDCRAVNSYRHNYMPCYGWAEFTLGVMERNY